MRHAKPNQSAYLPRCNGGGGPRSGGGGVATARRRPEKVGPRMTFRPRSLSHCPGSESQVGLSSESSVRPHLQLIYANRGTDDGMLRRVGNKVELTPDGRTNVEQGRGLPTSQYNQAISNAQALVRTFRGRLTFVGHSLGGGLATAQAAATGRRAIVFNPSGVHQNTVAAMGANATPEAPFGGVTAYVVSGEALDARVNGRYVGDISAPPTRGQRVMLPAVVPLRRGYGGAFETGPATTFDPKGRHSIVAVLSALYYDQGQSVARGQ